MQPTVVMSDFKYFTENKNKNFRFLISILEFFCKITFKLLRIDFLALLKCKMFFTLHTYRFMILRKSFYQTIYSAQHRGVNSFLKLGGNQYTLLVLINFCLVQSEFLTTFDMYQKLILNIRRGKMSKVIVNKTAS